MGNTNTIDSSASQEQIRAFCAQVRPLDLLVFRGGEGVSRMIMDLEKRQTGNGLVSHCEVAITREWCGKIAPIHAKTNIPDNDKTLFSWGSTLSGPLNDGTNNAETGGTTFGVQIRVLEDLVGNYLADTKANVGLCKLIDNPTLQRAGESDVDFAARSAKLKGLLDAAYDKFHGTIYNANPIALLSALFPTFRWLRGVEEEILAKFTHANQWLFCSEFAAALYEAVGIIDDSTDGVIDGKVPNVADIVPVDFLGSDADKHGLVKPICEIPPIWVKPLVEDATSKAAATTATTKVGKKEKKDKKKKEKK